MAIMDSRLRAAMAERGVDRLRLRDALGCSYAAATAWVVGDRNPQLSVFRDMCVALDVSADYLLGLKEDMRR